VETAFRGARTLARKGQTDPWLAERAKKLRKRTIGYAPILAAIEKYAVNDLERRRARRLEREIEVAFGSRTLVTQLGRTASVLLAAAWKIRLRVFGDGIQPKTTVTHYPDAVQGKAARKAEIIPLRQAADEAAPARTAAAARISTDFRPLLASEGQSRYKK
jgi:hypothetical protein